MYYTIQLELNRTIHFLGDAYSVTEILGNNRYNIKKVGGRKTMTIKMDGNQCFQV